MSTIGTKVVRTIELKPGQKFIVPSNATVTQVIHQGDGVADSECDLPAPSSFKCYFFRYELQENDLLKGIEINGEYHGLPTDVNSKLDPVNTINSHTTLNKFMKAFCMGYAENKWNLHLAIIEGIKTELVIHNYLSTNPQGTHYIRGTEDGSCTDCNNFS